MRPLLRTIAVCGALLTANLGRSAETDSPVPCLEVRPSQVRLTTARQAMRLVVTRAVGPLAGDVTRQATFESADPRVARVENGMVRPTGNGRTNVTVRVDGQPLVVPVEVSGYGELDPVSFQYDVLPALTKQGCNQGACHGSPSGKGGFRLSLRAYDPVLDMETLTREAYGRRVNTFAPATSLLLLKPTMRVAHAGGQKLRIKDAAYGTLHDWIAQGCQLDPADAPHCLGIEVYPSQRELRRPDVLQQLLVLGRFSDGSVRDLSAGADFLSSDTAIATVDDQGLVTSRATGEATILVRYLDQIATVPLVFLDPDERFRWPAPPENNVVDRVVFEKLRRLQIPPSELSTDDEFLRRVSLDVTGLLPTVEETTTFLAERDPQKRSRLIDQLLSRPEFARFWATKWADLLRVRKAKLSESGTYKFQHWLESTWRENLPYDQFARQLLTAQGNTLSNPAANFYRATADTNDCTETVSQLFLGIRMQCAKCHNHPFERWTQDNYYGISAFFTRVQRKKTAATDDLVIWLARQGEMVQPRTGRTMTPWLPLVGAAELEPDANRAIAFVDWLTSPKNPFFARMEVNRLWSQLLGRGIVEPVDDFRESNPAAHPALLDALAEELTTHDYDRRQVLRLILNSHVYQLSARPVVTTATERGNEHDDRYCSHARPRLLAAEQLLDAVCAVTGMPEKFSGVPAGTPATQLPHPDLEHEFLKAFGKPARESACACERSTDSNLSQALQMINGPFVHAKVHDERNRFRRLLAAGRTPSVIVDELYVAAVCRRPTDDEHRLAERHIVNSNDPAHALEDLCWALLNSNEFLFQH